MVFNHSHHLYTLSKSDFILHHLFVRERICHSYIPLSICTHTWIRTKTPCFWDKYDCRLRHTGIFCSHSWIRTNDPLLVRQMLWTNWAMQLFVPRSGIEPLPTPCKRVTLAVTPSGHLYLRWDSNPQHYASKAYVSARIGLRRHLFVVEEGLEPSRTFVQQILSLSCIPFHHSTILSAPLD